MEQVCEIYLPKLSVITTCITVFRVSDEKDARGYLQALATKMTEELENLKVIGVPGDDGVSPGTPSVTLNMLLCSILRVPNQNGVSQA